MAKRFICGMNLIKEFLNIILSADIVVNEGFYDFYLPPEKINRLNYIVKYLSGG